MSMNDLRGIWRGKRIDGYGAWVNGLLEYRDVDLSSAQLYNENDCEEFWVDPSTLGECTGLCDKNGKLIFEGDILAMDDYYLPIVVYWSKEDSRFFVDDTSDGFLVMDIRDVCFCEIIGNIHDNPELLKGDAEDGQD